MFQKNLESLISELEKKCAALEERYNDSVQALTVITEIRIAEQEIDMFDIDDKEK